MCYRKLKRRQFPTEKEDHLIITKALEILSAEPTLKQVSSPVTICGDIGGQFYAFLEIFHVGGNVTTVALFLEYIKYCLGEVLKMKIDNTLKKTYRP